MTTWESGNQKGRTVLEINEARDDGMAVVSAGPYANHLHLLQTDNNASTHHSNFVTGRMLFLMLSQQCQSIEGSTMVYK